MNPLDLQHDPLTFIREFLGAQLWHKQEEAVQAVWNNKQVTARSGHGVGKSYLAACVAITYLYTHPYSRVITTAPTDRQVAKIIWPEIHALHKQLEKKVHPVGELFQKELRVAPKWFAVGFSTDDPSSFQGHHAKHLLLIVDEACGIASDILDAAQGILTGEYNKALYIGNPTEPGTFFHRTHTGDIPGFYRMKISCYDSPNIRINEKGEYEDIKPLPYPGLVNLEWIERQRRIYGEDSNFFKTRVLGEFSEAADDQLIDGRSIATALSKGIRLRKILGLLKDQRRGLSPQEVQDILGR